MSSEQSSSQGRWFKLDSYILQTVQLIDFVLGDSGREVVAEGTNSSGNDYKAYGDGAYSYNNVNGTLQQTVLIWDYFC